MKKVAVFSLCLIFLTLPIQASQQEEEILSPTQLFKTVGWVWARNLLHTVDPFDISGYYVSSLPKLSRKPPTAFLKWGEDRLGYAFSPLNFLPFLYRPQLPNIEDPAVAKQTMCLRGTFKKYNNYLYRLLSQR